MNLGRKPAPKVAPAQLFNVRDDVGETEEVAATHPEVVARMLELAAEIRREIGDMDQPGTGQRPAGHVDHPVPLLLTE